MSYWKIYFLLTFVICGLASCSSLPIEQVPLKEPITTPENAKPAPIGFNKIVFALPTGVATISSSPQGLFGLLECEWPYGLTRQNSSHGHGFPTNGMDEIFFQVMKGQGYDVTGNPGRLFDERKDKKRSIYSVGGRIIDVKIDTCRHTNLWGREQGKSGEGHIKVEWSVFDLLKRKIVFKTTSMGYGAVETPNHEGVSLLFEDALAAAIHNLGANEGFYNFIHFGEEPFYDLSHPNNFKPIELVP